MLIGLRARLTRRSLWQVRYKDGKVIEEGQCDWSLLPRKGLIEVRLYCPNGTGAALGNDTDASDRLFQFKCATAYIDGRRSTDAHVIGIVQGVNGECKCYAWEYAPARLYGPFYDNFNLFKYGGPATATLSQDILGVKAS